MPADRIRSDYQELANIAREFGSRAASSRQMFQQIKQCMDTLQAGHWVGKGADKFYAEMNSAILPAVQRLINAFDSAQQVTQKISQVIKQAEEDAAALFKAAASGVASGAAGAGGSAAGGSGSGSSGGSSGGGSGSGGAGGSSGGGSSGGGSGGAGTASTVDQVFNGDSSQAKAPSTITLPQVLNDGMKDAWKDSFPKGHEQEQGGILVKTPSGDYKWIRGPAGTGGTWPPNFGDIGSNTLMGTGHTHPYDSGHTDVPFSTGDIEGFFTTNLNGKTTEKMMMVQSGDGQFVLARTEEFNNMIQGKSQAEVQKMTADMEKTYNDAVAKAQKNGASFAARYDAGVKAVADKYHLLYYKGKNGSLTLQ